LIDWLVRRHVTEAKRVLEIGCGTGFVLFALRKALPAVRIAGSELHSRGLKFARHRHGHRVELFQMDARRSNLADAIDVIGAFDVLEHIPDDEGVLAEIHRMLRPGGRLIATVPQHPWLWSASDEIAHHQRRYRTGELAAKARRAGFRILYQSSFATFALPLMVVSRMRSRRSGDNVSAADSLEVETRVPWLLNAALRIVFRAEHAVRRLGLPLPLGGSQVLVAEKLASST
jgi:SAM-dependent methyltransferase